jgi:hypothetical protein
MKRLPGDVRPSIHGCDAGLAPCKPLVAPRQRLLKPLVDDAGDLAALSVDELRDLADRLERDLIASHRSRADISESVARRLPDPTNRRKSGTEDVTPSSRKAPRQEQRFLEPFPGTLVMVLRKEFDPELNEWPRRVFALTSSVSDDYDSPDAFSFGLTEEGNPTRPGLGLGQDYAGAKFLSLAALLATPDAITQGAYVVVKKDREPNKGQARMFIEGELKKEVDYDIRPAGDKRHRAFTLGANPGGELNASLEIYEIIVYSRALDDAELAALDKYLKSWRGR